MTRVLLTGASGFVGRQVLRALLAAGLEVRAVVRRPIDQAGIEQHVTGDLFAANDAELAAMCSGIDIVVHCAWYAEPGVYLFSPINLDCLAGTLALVRAARATGVSRFIGVGTCFEYALSDEVLTVASPLDPRSPYAAAKAGAFIALDGILPQLEMSFAWCRLFYLYGEGEDARRLVPQLELRLAAGQPVDLTSGSQVRDYLDVAEAGRRIAAVALADHRGAANICSGEGVTIRALAEAIADRYGRRDLLRFGARPDNRVDPPHVVGEPWVEMEAAA